MEDQEFNACLEQCKDKHKDLSAAQLIELIQKNRCSNYSDEFLAEKFTRTGLVNMLCACVCDDRKESQDPEEESAKSIAPELTLSPPLSAKKT